MLVLAVSSDVAEGAARFHTLCLTETGNLVLDLRGVVAGRTLSPLGWDDAFKHHPKGVERDTTANSSH